MVWIKEINDIKYTKAKKKKKLFLIPEILKIRQAARDFIFFLYIFF